MTPNLLARTIETVEGGGIIVLLMRTVKSLKQLYTMAMVRQRDSFCSSKCLNTQSLTAAFLNSGCAYSLSN
jgi:tRNA(Met) C34 N-acetyltransferase TmcA